ncbi:formate/nitrate transporter. formate/nitrate transporter [Canicola haemoglobinophilus]|uniref:Formate/nitrate transporter. formate/nitrate transporter n=1 Tax=Canicola haemoglobinophilus TaxID=733 RepID=A0AB38H8W7_9PAST|nr:formate/nitrite transporter family protein [Canicola haemoglobinophilus]STO54027.1 formate/nitrate transporter. formate/nitrate transporter [Canicola haemoglobinophilus]STO68560.1 formate/nitrate transporter. formate/nitrate transporter [Canicola haemoglobinophilus]
MQNRDLYPFEILQEVIDKSSAKSNSSIKMLAILSFLGGGYVGFGYLAYLRVVSGIPADWGGIANLLGAMVFPICLICILIGGGELATGNMMMMALGKFTHRVNFRKLLRNWIIVSLGNLAGAVTIAFFLGHYVGLSEGIATAKTMAIAEAKVNMDFGRAFISAIACNWMVCMGIWFYFGAKQTSGRILAMWFPVMTFVLIGLQHFVANMFIIPAGIWAGADVTWGQFFFNMIPVFLGNVTGGATFVGASYLFAYKHLLKDDYQI